MKQCIPDQAFFIGGFSGARKKDGKPFYGLNFMLEVEDVNNRDGAFGNDVVVCFVDADDYKAFEAADVAGTIVTASISKGFSNQGTLISYDL